MTREGPEGSNPSPGALNEKLDDWEVGKEEIEQNSKGIAFIMKRLIMKPCTYPKAWRSKGEQAINVKVPVEVDLDKLENENTDVF